MSYTEMWTSFQDLRNSIPKQATSWKLGYMEGLALAIVHWPADRQCKIVGKHFHEYQDGYKEIVCYYQFVLNAYNELHTKEYGE